MTIAAANLAGTWSMMKHEHERGLPIKSAGIDSCGGTVGFFLCPISG
jgi:hypothetical protein